MNGESLSTFVGQPDRPLIIGGCPRSGTTLLQAGPEVAIPRETRFVLEAWRERRRFGDLRDADNRRRLARWIFMREETQAHRLGLDAGDAVKRLVVSPPPLGSMLTTCFVMFAEKHEKPRWGDKRPLYAARMSAIHEPVSAGVAASAELLRGFTRQRRLYAAAQLKLASKERLQKVVGHRYPLSEIRN